MGKKDEKSSKYKESVKVEIPEGFTFDDFVGAVAKADPSKVKSKIEQLEMWESLIANNQQALKDIEAGNNPFIESEDEKKTAIERCLAQIERAKRNIEKLKSDQ